MSSLSLYETHQKRRVIRRLVCYDLALLQSNLTRLRADHNNTEIWYIRRTDGTALVRVSATENISSSLTYYASTDLFDLCLVKTSGAYFIQIIVDDDDEIQAKELFGATLSYIKKRSLQELRLQILGTKENVKQAFVHVLSLLDRDVFRKHIDFERSDIERAEEISLVFVQDMINTFRYQRKFEEWYAYQIVLQAKRIFTALPSLVEIGIPNHKHVTVCGDIHGQFYDMLNIFKINGFPSRDNPYLFNGDFVDRGSFSVETILTLFAIKCNSPTSIYLGRGNHESKSMNSIYGFEDEILSKLRRPFVDLFADAFCSLPLAHVINGKIFVVHGGLFSVDGVKLSDIRAIDRFCEPPEEGLMRELLWSDPRPLPGRGPSKRGTALTFGGDVTKRFLQENNLDLLVRSHEVKDEGYEFQHDGKLITVFSAPNYCDQVGNKGAFIRFTAPEMLPDIFQFDAVAHPDA